MDYGFEGLQVEGLSRLQEGDKQVLGTSLLWPTIGVGRGELDATGCLYGKVRFEGRFLALSGQQGFETAPHDEAPWDRAIDVAKSPTVWLCGFTTPLLRNDGVDRAALP